MTSNRRLLFAPNAEADFRDILQYSEETWGAEQRATYGAGLMDAIIGLLHFPRIGGERPHMGRGVRGKIYEDHVILYRVETRAIRILRVVHTKRDLSSIVDL